MDFLTPYLNFEKLLFGRTWVEVVWLAALALIALAILWVVKRILAVGSTETRGRMADHFIWTHCDDCGWSGEVPKYQKKCPHCAATIHPE
ncbi:MAG: hypothetical protein P9M14_16615 [Candidatus Alcyoniella australis]|nr:hypothetical protein [Candidatus Alcyoniella australis]